MGQSQNAIYDIDNIKLYEPSLLLNGTHKENNGNTNNQSQARLIDIQDQMNIAKLDAPRQISTLFSEWNEQTAQIEFMYIEEMYQNDRRVPSTKIIDASFVKTPFLERLPASEDLVLQMLPPSKDYEQEMLPPSKNYCQEMLPPSGDSAQEMLPPSKDEFQEMLPPSKFEQILNQNNQSEVPFGLIIASNANSAKEGLLEFWQMIVNENVHIINSLNEGFTRDENNYEDIYRYFPNKSELNLNVANTFKIELATNPEHSQSSVTRLFQIRDHGTDKLLHTVKHVHFHQWQDFSTPSDASLFDFSAMLQRNADFLFEQIDNLQSRRTDRPQKLLVHCRAGRGRTGTTLSILNSMMSLQWQIKNLSKRSSIEEIEIKESLALSIFQVVRRLRQQRAYAVETQDQYSYIYKFVDYWLTNKLKEGKWER